MVQESAHAHATAVGFVSEVMTGGDIHTIIKLPTQSNNGGKDGEHQGRTYCCKATHTSSTHDTCKCMAVMKRKGAARDAIGWSEGTCEFIY